MLKLALNKSMGVSDNEQGINKLWPKQDLISRFAEHSGIENQSERILVKTLW